MPGQATQIYRFADLEVHEHELRATRRGHQIDIEPKAFRVLVYLIKHAGHLVTKGELIEAVWGETAVTDNSLTRAIALLRRALEDDPHQPRFIETVTAGGYRFICAVEAEGDIPDGAICQPGSPSSFVASSTRRAVLWATASIAVACVAAFAYFVIANRNSRLSLRISEYTQLTHNGHADNVGATDGSRLFLNTGLLSPITQVSVSGGDIEPVSSITLPRQLLVDLSPDGSNLLVKSYEKGKSLSEPLYVVQVVGGAHHYLTDAVGATWSPDGKLVTFSTLTGDLNVINIDGTGARKLTSAGGIATWIRWSPDSDKIRFTKSSELWEITSNGSRLHRLFSESRHSDAKCCGTWSPNGEFYAFIDFGPDGRDSQIYALDERRGLFRQTIKQPFQLTSGPIGWSPPVFSKDGKRLFSTGTTQAGELVRVDPKSNQIQPFLGGISANLVTFSKDRQFVAYVTYPDGILWKARVDGSDRTQLTSPPLYPTAASWSPDGSEFALMALSPEGRQQAWLIPVKGGTPQRLLPEDTGEQTDPNWSPDGSKIIFATGLLNSEQQGSSIRILEVATHEITTLPGSAGMFGPHWSPDGRSILANSLDISTMYIFDMKTQHWSPLHIGIHAFERWSRDSRFIYFLRFANDPAVLRIPITGGEAKVMVDLKGFRFAGTLGVWFGLDLTDAPLLLRDVSTSDVYALTLEKGILR
jgi:eukaryotic-like serine/threonine-protein kinase